MNLTFPGKIFIVVVIICSTFLFSRYQRNKYIDLSAENAAPILTQLPKINLKTVSKKGTLSTHDFLGKKSSGVFVHLWGTWCAPCEAELPEFLTFAKKFEKENVTFLLIAVNDEMNKIKKFIKKYGKLPKNILFVLDHEDKAMDQFGSGRVPETYLFDKSGTFTERFIGPQNWAMETYLMRVKDSLSLN